MATVAASGGVGVPTAAIKLQSHRPSSNPTTTPFLGKKLAVRLPLKTLVSSPRALVLASGGELIDAVKDLFLGVGVGLPCTVMECGDIIYRSTLPKSSGLTLTAPGAVLALGTLSYLWATPGVAPGFFDMFFLAFVERLFRPTFRKDDFVLGKKLGEGAFGVVYRVSLAKKSSSNKEGDLVLKKATEYGAVEIWMNERVRRACASSCADFVYGFLEVLLYIDSWLNCGLTFNSRGNIKIEKTPFTSLVHCYSALYLLSEVVPKKNENGSRLLQRKEESIGLYGDLKGNLHLQI